MQTSMVCDDLPDSDVTYQWWWSWASNSTCWSGPWCINSSKNEQVNEGTKEQRITQRHVNKQMKNIGTLGCEHTCRWMGSCVLKASVVECWLIPSFDISINTSADYWPIDDQVLIEVSIKCQFSVKWVSNDIVIKISVECWLWTL